MYADRDEKIRNLRENTEKRTVAIAFQSTC